MATKDKWYDPPVSCEESCSGGEEEEEELNNSVQKYNGSESPTTLWDDPDFVFNDTRYSSNRYGGPLADNDGKSSTPGLKQKTGTCISCETANVPLWQGNRYRCHSTPQKQHEHNSFCKDCAQGFDEDGDVMQCPKHLENAWPRSERIDPKPVYD